VETALFRTSSPTQQVTHLRALLGLARDTPERRSLCQPREVSATAVADRQLAQQIFAYLLRHAAAPLRQSDVARHFGLSIAGFSRLFTREFGKPFVRYRAELRVGHASHLLMAEELSISEVALASGFGTVASLDRQFRSVKGTTPRDFRRLARQMNHV
jgi:AraC-like DNA-binding protein